MPGDEVSLKAITRILLLGTSLGATPLAVVGCTTDPNAAPAASAGPTRPVAVAAAPAANSETVLCQQALASADPRQVDRLLRTYPRARCIPAVLAAMPPQVLRQVSPSALAALPPETVRRISPNVQAQLRMPATEGGPSRPLADEPDRRGQRQPLLTQADPPSAPPGDRARLLAYAAGNSCRTRRAAV